MKKIIGQTVILSLLLLPLAAAMPVGAATAPNWNVVGSYQWLAAGTYAHDLVITTQNPDGTFSGTGGYPAGSAPYAAAGQTPELVTGQVTGDAITFTSTYTGPLNPGYSVTASGTIASDGSMSGTSPFEWHTTSGKAVPVSSSTASLAAQDFGVVNYDTGLGILKGYTAGFGLTNATFVNVQSVVEKLYASSTLLQTNTATSKVGTTLTGSDISSPFDVSGSFNYVTDGYWTNVRQAEYGQTLPATRVVATVTLAGGQVVTAENDTLSGNPTTIMPVVATSTLPMVSIGSPLNNANVSGTIAIAVNASDTSSAITKVKLFVDGMFGLKKSTSSPYVFSLNTVLLSNGKHTLTAKAYDAAGNVGTSTVVSIMVNNRAVRGNGGDDGSGSNSTSTSSSTRDD
jgi:hypothetical protein